MLFLASIVTEYLRFFFYRAIISSVLSFKDNIGMWKIVLNQITDADFVIGYGFDNLYNKVKFQYKMIKC